jgi:hypothetical protein
MLPQDRGQLRRYRHTPLFVVGTMLEPPLVPSFTAVGPLRARMGRRPPEAELPPAIDRRHIGPSRRVPDEIRNHDVRAAHVDGLFRA